MATNTTPTGLTEIDGVASSSVSFKRDVQNEEVRYQLIFRSGNKQVARLNGLTADQVTAALGEENGRAVHWSAEPKGLLKGKALQYAQGVSPAQVEQLGDANSRDRTEDAVLKTYADPAPATAPPSSAVDMREDTQNERAREIQDRQAGNDLRLDKGEVETAPKDNESPPAAKEDSKDDNEVVKDSEIEDVSESDEQERARAREAERAAALADLESGFYHVENKFYHRDNQNRVAFVESPNKLRTAESDAFVAKSMVKLAEARGWDSIKVNGTAEFRRAVWMEAAVRGLQVRGYKPNDVDLAQLKEKQEARLNNTIEQGDSPKKHVHERAGAKQSEVDGAAKQASMSPDQQSDAAQKIVAPEKGVVGVMLSHGAAKYEFKPDEKLSYYARLQTEAGERILWGVDLRRALNAEGIKDGDRVRLENLGRTAVVVEANVRDDQGNVVGKEMITTHRNEWSATPAPEQSRSADGAATVPAKLVGGPYEFQTEYGSRHLEVHDTVPQVMQQFIREPITDHRELRALDEMGEPSLVLIRGKSDYATVELKNYEQALREAAQKGHAFDSDPVVVAAAQKAEESVLKLVLRDRGAPEAAARTPDGPKKPITEAAKGTSALAAAAFKANSDRSTWVATAEQHPELKNAYGNLAVLAKFAEQRLPEGQRAAFLQRQVQNIARDIEAGRPVAPVKIVIEADRSKEKSTEAATER